MKFNWLLINIFFIGYIPLLLAQSNIAFENISTQNGLSTAHTNQVIQDQKGFIWIATGNGLNRYDGIDFTVFKYQKNNPNSISGNNIRCLMNDSKGRIWIGTLSNGLSRYDYETGQFVRYYNQEENESTISSNEILSLFEDSKGRIWVGTEYGLNLYDSDTDSFVSFTVDEKNNKSIKASAVLTIAEDHRGWLWVGTWDGGLNLLVPTEKPNEFEFRHFLRGEKPTDLKSNHVWKIFLDKSNQLWLGTYSGGLSVMLPNEEQNPALFEPKFQTFLQENGGVPIANNVVFGVNQDKDGQMWVATVNGLTVFKPLILQDGKINLVDIKHYQNSFSNNKSLIHNEMRSIFIDKNGFVWCSTVGGVSKYDKNNTQFKHFVPKNKKGTNLLTAALLEYDENTVYIGTLPELGLLEYNPKKNTYKSYTIKNAKQTPEFISFFKENEETIWIGTRTSLVLFNPITKVFKNYPLVNPTGRPMVNLHVRKILLDKHKKLWLATGSGLVSFDKEKETFDFAEKDSEGNTLANTDINDILIDDKERMWLATYGGLSRVDFKENGTYIFKSYTHSIEDSTSIGSNRVISLTTVNKELWIGTENGLAKYNEATDDFKNLNAKDGGENPNVISMLKGNDNRLWLGTRQGLIAVNTETLDIVHYDDKDGLTSNSFSINSTYKNKDGVLFFGGTNGYLSFKSEEIEENSYIPSVFITDVKIFNKSRYWKKDVTNLKKISFQPNENYFTVDFAALNYTQSLDNQYAYKLEGFNNEWIYCGRQKSVSFSNLKGGHYILRVKASNNDGVWNEEGAQLQIEVIPPVWEEMWFKLLLGFIVIGMISWFYYRRISRVNRQKIKLKKEVKIRTQEIVNKNAQIEELVEELRNQNLHLEELVKERTVTLERSNIELQRSNHDLERFAYIASHDLQEPLRTIGSFTQLLSKRYSSNFDENAQEYMGYITNGVKRMSQLIKGLLSYSQLGRSDVEFSDVDLKSIIENKVADLAFLIKERNATITISEMPDKIFCEKTQIGIVFYNLINNAIKFNVKPNPIVNVRLHEEDEQYWIFSVEDNGIGIKEEFKDKVFEIFRRLHAVGKFEGNGIGLASCKRVIMRHEGDIWLTSELNEGTTFYFSISKNIKNG